MEAEKKNYSETLNLPKTDFPMRGGLPEKEPQILEELYNKNIYSKMVERNKNTGKSFVLHDGPPYANGNIHLGHAFNKILKDIIIKYKNMSGFYAPYIPGWDTHGLPIEKKVEQVLKISKDMVGIPEFRRKCKEYALEQVELQKKGFKRLGVLGDFENRYVTLDPDFEVEQIKVFAIKTIGNKSIVESKPFQLISTFKEKELSDRVEKELDNKFVECEYCHSTYDIKLSKCPTCGAPKNLNNAK